MQNTEVTRRISSQHLIHRYSRLGLSAKGGGWEEEAAKQKGGSRSVDHVRQFVVIRLSTFLVYLYTCILVCMYMYVYD